MDEKGMNSYEQLIKQLIERYFYDEIYEDSEYIDVKVTSNGMNRIMVDLLNDDNFLSDLDFLIIDRIKKEPYWIDSDGEEFL